MKHVSFASPAAGQLACSVAPRSQVSARPLLLLAFLLAFLAPSTVLHAQTVYGSISGVVKDSSGAVVPGVDVVVQEAVSTTEYKTVTNKTGSYRISFLKPGGYIVRFQKDGFAQFATGELNLVLNQALVVDGSLKLGAASEIVTVTNAASSLNDTDPQVGGELSGTELVDLPENTSSKGANEFLITRAFAGASSTSQDYSNVNNLSLGGGRPVSNPIIIDGLPSNMGTDGTYGLIPTPDSTEELQVLTAPFSAQYGQSGGGAILTTTKSGADHFHGSAFEEYNSQALTALGYFQARTTVLPPTSFNYFGGSIGGPVLIPRLLDGRKRHLYFFTDWEDTLNNALAAINADVPTLAERSGDFSGPLPNGTMQPVGDPNTTVVSPKGAISRSPFQGNVIPMTRLDPVGMSIVALYPMPNASCTNILYNYCLNLTAHSSYLYNADRIDFNATDHDHIWAKFSRDGPRNQPVPEIPNIANNSAFNGWTDDHDEVSWSHMFSPRISNEARVGYVSEVNFSYPLTPNASSLGLQGVPLTQFPSISTTLFPGLGAGSYAQTRDGHIILNDAMVLQLGHHSLSVGGEFMRYAYSYYTPGVLSGSYTFSGIYTNLTGQSGFGLPDLELGLVQNGSISTTNTIFHENLNYFAGYVQDDYRITQKLTINLGLRYEFDGPYAESHNNDYTFDPNIVDPTTGKQGGIEFAGFNGAPHSLIANVYTGVLPRIGFNYHALRRTVVRGGYGIYELPSIGYGTTGLTSASTTAASFVSATPTYTPAFQLSQGVPAYHANVGPNGEPLIPTSLTSPSFSPVERQLTPVLPYLQEWQFGVQQDFGHNWILDLNYEGNHGVHLPTVLPINQIVPGSLSTAGTQSQRPYPQFQTVSYLTNGAASAYAALYATLTHRWSNGVSIHAAYTWAHTLDDADGPSRDDAAPIQNVYNLHAQWGTALQNIPQRFSLSAVYALPFGSGSRLLNRTPVLAQAIGHWKVSTLAQFQMGYPYFITQAVNQLGVFSGAQYATEVANPNLPRGSRTVAQWFNPNAFAITAPLTLGNTPRAALYGPGQNVWALSIMREIPVHEQMKFTVRIDANNAFNHPQFSGLNTSFSTVTVNGVTKPVSTFGTVTGAQDPRVLLLIGRFNF
jgi:Carboxypeptidase regulatory-like domain